MISIEQDLKNHLRILNGLNPAMRKEITKRFKALTKPAVDAANNAKKGQLPRGFDHNGRTGARADKPVASKVDTRKARRRNAAVGANYESLAVLKILTKAAPSAIADMAGKVGDIAYGGRSRAYPGRPNGHALNGQGAKLIEALNNKPGGNPSRFMWPAVESTMSGYERELRSIVDDIEKEINKELMKIGSSFSRKTGIQK